MSKFNKNRKSHALSSPFLKGLAAFVLILVIGAFAYDGSFAYLIASGNAPQVNEFAAPSVETKIQETFTQGDFKKSNVYLTNTGNVDAYMRCTVLITWKSPDGRIFGTRPIRGLDYYDITYSNVGWVNSGSDDIYYCTSPVAPGKDTSVVIEECERFEKVAPEGYELSVEIIAEAIQADPPRAVKEAWGVNIASDGTLSL